MNDSVDQATMGAPILSWPASKKVKNIYFMFEVWKYL